MGQFFSLLSFLSANKQWKERKFWFFPSLSLFIPSNFIPSKHTMIVLSATHMRTVNV